MTNDTCQAAAGIDEDWHIIPCASAPEFAITEYDDDGRRLRSVKACRRDGELIVGAALSRGHAVEARNL